MTIKIVRSLIDRVEIMRNLSKIKKNDQPNILGPKALELLSYKLGLTIIGGEGAVT